MTANAEVGAIVMFFAARMCHFAFVTSIDARCPDTRLVHGLPVNFLEKMQALELGRQMSDSRNQDHLLRILLRNGQQRGPAPSALACCELA